MNPGWTRVKFGEVVRLSRERSADPLAEGIERYVGLEHIEPGDIRICSWGEVADGTTFTNRFRPGQVLFGKRRAYQRKVAVADFEGVCSGDIYVFESADPSRLLPTLLPFICQTDAFFGHAVNTSAGSLSPRTNWSSLAEYVFALPAPEEQHRWVEVLSATVHLQSELTSAIALSRRVFDRLAFDLLLPRATRFNKDSTLLAAPPGWSSVAIRDLCKRRVDLTIGPFGSNLLSSEYAGRTSGVPVIFVRDIRPNRFCYVSDCFVSSEKAAELSSHIAAPGDLLITKVGVPEFMGVPPGLAAVLPADFPESVITADVVRARLNPDAVLAQYVACLLNTSWGRQQTWRISPGSTTRFKMTLSNFSEIVLPIPPLEYQRKAVAALTEVSSATKSLTARLASAREVARRLLNGMN